MLEHNYDDIGYDSGYVVGYDFGRHEGYVEGYNDCVEDYEPRIQKMWVEIQTLNARIGYLEKQAGREEQ